MIAPNTAMPWTDRGVAEQFYKLQGMEMPQGFVDQFNALESLQVDTPSVEINTGDGEDGLSGGGG